MKKLIRKIKRRFVATPTREFGWSVADFEAAKKWAKTQDDPDSQDQALWDACYPTRNESSYVLAKINNYLRPLLK